MLLTSRVVESDDDDEGCAPDKDDDEALSKTLDVVF